MAAARTGEDPEAVVRPTVEEVLAGSLSPSHTRARQLLEDAARLDVAMYEAVAATSSPAVDEPLRRLSTAANRSALWLAIAAGLAAVGVDAADGPPSVGWPRSWSHQPS